jgi:hypothetical protein
MVDTCWSLSLESDTAARLIPFVTDPRRCENQLPPVVNMRGCSSERTLPYCDYRREEREMTTDGEVGSTVQQTLRLCPQPTA